MKMFYCQLRICNSYTSFYLGSRRKCSCWYSYDYLHCRKQLVPWIFDLWLFYYRILFMTKEKIQLFKTKTSSWLKNNNNHVFIGMAHIAHIPQLEF